MNKDRFDSESSGQDGGSVGLKETDDKICTTL